MKQLVQAISFSDFKDKEENNVDPDKVAQYNEPPHLTLRCLHIQIFSVLAKY